jgi:hypothetical protein
MTMELVHQPLLINDSVISGHYIQHSAEGLLSCADQKTHGLCKEVAKKIYQTQLDL